MTRTTITFLVQVAVVCALACAAVAQEQQPPNKLDIPKLLDRMNEPLPHRQAIELEKERAEEQKELKLLQNPSYAASPQWCITAMRALKYASIDQYQKMVLFEQMKSRKCMGQ